MGWVIVYSLCNMIYQEFFIQNFSQPTVTKYRNHHIYLCIQILCRHSLQRLWFIFASIDTFYKGYTNVFFLLLFEYFISNHFYLLRLGFELGLEEK